MITFSGVDELKSAIETELKTWHRGHEKRAEKWQLVERVCRVIIPEHERNNNNPHERRVRMAISQMRKAGRLICSDTAGGYWWANSIDDVLSVSDGLRSRAKDLLKTARQLRAEAMREFGGQQRMF